MHVHKLTLLLRLCAFFPLIAPTNSPRIVVAHGLSLPLPCSRGTSFARTASAGSAQQYGVFRYIYPPRAARLLFSIFVPCRVSLHRWTEESGNHVDRFVEISGPTLPRSRAHAHTMRQDVLLRCDELSRATEATRPSAACLVHLMCSC